MATAPPPNVEEAAEPPTTVTEADKLALMDVLANPERYHLDFNTWFALNTSDELSSAHPAHCLATLLAPLLSSLGVSPPEATLTLSARADKGRWIDLTYVKSFHRGKRSAIAHL